MDRQWLRRLFRRKEREAEECVTSASEDAVRRLDAIMRKALRLYWSDNWIGDVESRVRYNGERRFNYTKVIGHRYLSWATL